MKATDKIRGAYKNHRGLAVLILFPVIAAYMIFSFSPFGKNVWHGMYRGLGLGNFSDNADDYTVNVHVLNVGKADSILLEAEGVFVLVDGGTFADSDQIIEYLRTRGFKRLNAVIASHSDSDHIGGLPAVLDEFGTDVLYTNGFGGEPTHESMLLEEAAERNGTVVKTLKSGVGFSVGDVSFSVFAPRETYKESNDNSIVIKAVMGGFSMLFTGDMAENELEDLLQSNDDLSADILKVSHHGSKTGTCPELLERVSPRYSVISVGDNVSALPADETLETLKAHGGSILRTDEAGSLLISWAATDAAHAGGNYIVHTEKTVNNQ